MKSIDIIITTWPRYEERNQYLERVLKSLREHLMVDGYKTRWFITSESQDITPKNKKELGRIAKLYKFELHFRTGPANLGANLNYAHSLSKGDYIIYVQDDFMCTEKIDVSIDIDFFEKNPTFELVRYYWRGATLPKENLINTHFLLSKKCRRYYSDNPHIKTKNFHKVTGDYVTIDNSKCEHSMNDAARKSKMQIALRRNPSDPATPRTRFVHIGYKSAMTEKWWMHPKNVASRKAAAEKAKKT